MSICAIIISYNPKESIKKSIDVLISQVDYIIIVDNGSNANSIELLHKYESKDCLKIIYLKKNIGIAGAMNVGISDCANSGFDWILTLDQDSILSENMLSAMIESYNNCKELLNIGIISPVYKDINAGVIGSNPVVKNNKFLTCCEVEYAITSGSLIRYDILKQIGLFDEKYFIDFIDIEFCLRLRLYGYSVVQVNNAILFHELGRSERKRFLWRECVATNHSPLRKYYFYRNAMLTYKKYFKYYKFWVFRSLITLFKTLLVVALYEENKVKKFRAFFYGTLDGFLGRSGECNRHF